MSAFIGKVLWAVLSYTIQFVIIPAGYIVITGYWVSMATLSIRFLREPKVNHLTSFCGLKPVAS